MNGFSQTIDTARSSALSACDADGARKKVDATLAPIWDNLMRGEWPLSPAADIKPMEASVRDVYARVLDTTVMKLHFIRDAEIVPLPIRTPTWMHPGSGAVIQKALSFDIAAAVDTHRLVAWLRQARPRDVRFQALEALEDPMLGTAIWHCLVGSIGPSGAAAARVLTAMMQEYVMYMTLGMADKAAPIGDLLQTFLCGIAIAPHQADSRTLVVLCGR